MAKFVCNVCGYVHEGNEAPAQCPQCKVGSDKFTKVVEGERAWAAEHVVGVAKGAREDIIMDLIEHYSKKYDEYEEAKKTEYDTEDLPF